MLYQKRGIQMNDTIIYSLILLISVLVSSVSQVLLKKSALKNYSSKIKEYLNPLVIFAYFMFFSSTILTVIAYKVVPLSFGPILEATSYIYITFFGLKFFDEKITKKKIITLVFIILGIAVFSLG